MHIGSNMSSCVCVCAVGYYCILDVGVACASGVLLVPCFFALLLCRSLAFVFMYYLLPRRSSSGYHLDNKRYTSSQVKEVVAIPTKAFEEAKANIESLLPTPPKVSPEPQNIFIFYH